jgi:hypothetical protein
LLTFSAPTLTDGDLPVVAQSRHARGATTRVLTGQGYHVHRAIAIPDLEAAICSCVSTG